MQGFNLFIIMSKFHLKSWTYVYIKYVYINLYKNVDVKIYINL